MSKTKIKGGRHIPRAERITVTLLVMGAPDHTETFYSKPAAKAYFLKWHESVNAYPLVTVGEKTLPTITAARRYFGIEGRRATPWAKIK